MKSNRKEKKKLPKETVGSLFVLLAIAVSLGITLPLHFTFPDTITTNWAVAICVAIIAPFAIANAKFWLESKGNYTEEQKKAASAKFGIAILSVWYADFAFVCMFLEWLVAFFVLTGLFLVKLIYDVTVSLLKRQSPSAYPNFVILVDYIFGFLLLVLLIYKIPDDQLRTIVLALVAALLGGLLTLLGVMMTIQKSDKDKREERANQIRPFFYYTPYFGGPEYDTKKTTCHDKHFSLPGKHNHCLGLGRFVNSDKTEFLIKAVVIAEVSYPCTFDPAVSKGELFTISVLSESPIAVPDEYFLVAEDVDKNEIKIRISIKQSNGENVPVNIEVLK